MAIRVARGTPEESAVGRLPAPTLFVAEVFENCRQSSHVGFERRPSGANKFLGRAAGLEKAEQCRLWGRNHERVETEVLNSGRWLPMEPFFWA